MSGVGFCGFARVMGCMKRMGVGAVGVMSCGLMMTAGVVPSGFLVMPSSMLVMPGRFQMVLMGRVASMRWFLCHAFSP
jgi:hypothetical protein